MHRHIADRIEAGDRTPLQIARENLDRWRQLDGQLGLAQAEWAEILDWSLPRLLALLRAAGNEEAIRLRGTSPFAGSVQPQKRMELLREARAA